MIPGQATTNRYGDLLKEVMDSIRDGTPLSENRTVDIQRIFNELWDTIQHQFVEQTYIRPKIFKPFFTDTTEFLVGTNKSRLTVSPTVVDIRGSQDNVVGTGTGFSVLTVPLYLYDLTFGARFNTSFYWYGTVTENVSGTYADYLSSSVDSVEVYRFNTTGATVFRSFRYDPALTGVGSIFHGKVLVFINVGANTLTLNHEDGAGTSDWRFTLKGAANLALAAGQVAILWYDGTSTRWRVLATS